MDKQTRRILEKSTPSDFDGHTEFSRMTPDERLSWLDEANAAFLELHGLAQQSLRVAEEHSQYRTGNAPDLR
ncbi:MAG: hypothetical protein KJN98_07885 [Pontiella sp.]|nr:hypothetical protein [Pontiella sp.]